MENSWIALHADDIDFRCVQRAHRLLRKPRNMLKLAWLFRPQGLYSVACIATTALINENGHRKQQAWTEWGAGGQYGVPRAELAAAKLPTRAACRRITG